MINLFFLDHDMCYSAQYTYDIHLRQQIVELTQVIFNVRHYLKLCTAHFNYKYRHRNHIFTKWGITSLHNYLHLIQYCYILQKELIHRGYPNTHSCIKMINQHIETTDFLTPFFTNINKTNMPQFMPDVFKRHDTVIAYRLYYYFLKRYKLPYGTNWTNRGTPYWYSDLFFLQNVEANIQQLILGETGNYIKPKFKIKK